VGKESAYNGDEDEHLIQIARRGVVGLARWRWMLMEGGTGSMQVNDGHGLLYSTLPHAARTENREASALRVSP
jgi:hypothetical protein